MDDSSAAGSRRPLGATPALFDFRLRVDEALDIRLLRLEHAVALFELTERNREHLAPWMAWIDVTGDVADTYAFLRAAEKEAHEQSAFKCGLWSDGDLIGAIDLHEINWTNRHAQIGYWLDQAHTGRGIVTRAVQRIMQYAFDTLDLHRIEIHVATENRASRRIPERLGFTLEGVLREVQYLRGRYVDHAIYAFIRP